MAEQSMPVQQAQAMPGQPQTQGGERQGEHGGRRGRRRGRRGGRRRRFEERSPGQPGETRGNQADPTGPATFGGGIAAQPASPAEREHFQAAQHEPDFDDRTMPNMSFQERAPEARPAEVKHEAAEHRTEDTPPRNDSQE